MEVEMNLRRVSLRVACGNRRGHARWPRGINYTLEMWGRVRKRLGRLVIGSASVLGALHFTLALIFDQIALTLHISTFSSLASWYFHCLSLPTTS